MLECQLVCVLYLQFKFDFVKILCISALTKRLSLKKYIFFNIFLTVIGQVLCWLVKFRGDYTFWHLRELWWQTFSISLPLTLPYAKLRKLLCIKRLAKIQFYVDIIDKV